MGHGSEMDTEDEFGGIDWDEMDDCGGFNWDNQEAEEADEQGTKTGMWRFELELLPSEDHASNLVVAFEKLRALPLKGVTWLGWRTEPWLYGAEKMILIVTLQDKVYDDTEVAIRIIEDSVMSLEMFQQFSMRGPMKEYIGDPFEVCSRLFKLKPHDLDGIPLRRLTVEQLRKLMASGYVIVDDWMPTEIVDEVSSLVEGSLNKYIETGEFLDDGIEWKHKEPKAARADMSTDLEERPNERPATDRVFAATVVPAFDELQEDLKSCVHLRGARQQQLSYYPGNGLGYSAHFDAWPVDDPESEIRKTTAIMYCNSGWKPEDGGALKVWLPDHEGARIIDVEPIGGRLIVFLSGCIRHEVSPVYKPRVAFTNWLI